jgi:hypothetical protein
MSLHSRSPRQKWLMPDALAGNWPITYFHPALKHFRIRQKLGQTGFHPVVIPYHLAKNRTSARPSRLPSVKQSPSA